MYMYMHVDLCVNVYMYSQQLPEAWPGRKIHHALMALLIIIVVATCDTPLGEI